MFVIYVPDSGVGVDEQEPASADHHRGLCARPVSVLLRQTNKFVLRCALACNS